MAGTEHPTPLRLGPQDAGAGLRLSDEAHWNQTEDEWRFFLIHGTVLGIRDSAGQLIATAALLPYSSNAAWISMVLVTQRWRRQQRRARGAQNRPSFDHGCTDTDEAHCLPPAASQIVRTTRRALTSAQATPSAIDVSRCCFKVAFPPGAIG